MALDNFLIRIKAKAGVKLLIPLGKLSVQLSNFSYV